MCGICVGGSEQVGERAAGPRRGQRDSREHHCTRAGACAGACSAARGAAGAGGGRRRRGGAPEHREVVLVLGDELRVLREGGERGGRGGLFGGARAAEVARFEAARVDHVERALTLSPAF